MEGNIVFHPLHLVIFIIKCDATFVKKNGTKIDVIAKTCGVNNKSRVLAYNHVTIEIKEPDFLQSPECHGCSCTYNQKDP